MTRAREFLKQLQQAVAGEDRTTVASMIQFPVGYGAPDGPAQLDNKQFVERYSEVLNDQVKSVLAQQRPEDLYCSNAGLGVGHGEIWFTEEPGTNDFRVTTFLLSKYAAAGIDTMADTDDVDRFFLRLQNSIRENDSRTVASMVMFPLSVYTQKGTVLVRTKTAMVKRFDWVFNAAVKKKLASVKLRDLFATDHGIGVGDGVIWIGPPVRGRKLGPTLLSVSNGT